MIGGKEGGREGEREGERGRGRGKRNNVEQEGITEGNSSDSNQFLFFCVFCSKSDQESGPIQGGRGSRWQQQEIDHDFSSGCMYYQIKTDQ